MLKRKPNYSQLINLQVTIITLHACVATIHYLNLWYIATVIFYKYMHFLPTLLLLASQACKEAQGVMVMMNSLRIEIAASMCVEM